MQLIKLSVRVFFTSVMVWGLFESRVKPLIRLHDRVIANVYSESEWVLFWIIWMGIQNIQNGFYSESLLFRSYFINKGFLSWGHHPISLQFVDRIISPMDNWTFFFFFYFFSHLVLFWYVMYTNAVAVPLKSTEGSAGCLKTSAINPWGCVGVDG